MTEALLDCRVLKDQLEQLASLGFLALPDCQVCLAVLDLLEVKVLQVR